MAIVVGCDLHSRFQQVAVMDLETGEVLCEQRVEHEGDQVRSLYQRWSGPVTMAIEATGYTTWFAQQLAELGHQLVAGDAARLRAMEPRRQKTDRRDALHLASVFASGRFPAIGMADPARRDLRHLLLHRHRLVRTRTLVKNHLHALAMNHGLCRKRALFSVAGRQRLEALAMAPFEGWRRAELLEWLDGLNGKVQSADQQLQQQLPAWPEAGRLMTHPGVGPVTALAWVAFVGDAGRFPGSARLCSYLGLIPREAAAAGGSIWARSASRATRSFASCWWRRRRRRCAATWSWGAGIVGWRPPRGGRGPRWRWRASWRCDCIGCRSGVWATPFWRWVATRRLARAGPWPNHGRALE
ncbi:MAG TPA: IS110 family transposase [Terriglobales bacterium]|nr:IS110 family transposase [Terriglobales bacterium]